MRGARAAGLVVTVAVLVACGIGAVLVKRAFAPRDGESLARQAVRDEAARLNSRFGYRNRLRDAESVAAEVTPDRQSSRVTMTPVDWAGRIYADEKATVDVRFTAAVDADAGFMGRGNTAGSATRCFRYTLQYYRYTDYREIDCPLAARNPPKAQPVLRLPADAADRLAAALRSATPEDLAAKVRERFPADGFAIDTATTGGTLVAAVGVPAERDCLVMIRTADGKTANVGFDREQLEPGETGCRASLYTNPPR